MTDTTHPQLDTPLLPCPFCGGSPKLRDLSGGRRFPPFDVICTGKIGDAECQCHLWPAETAEQAIAAWNTRPTPADTARRSEISDNACLVSEMQQAWLDALPSGVQPVLISYVAMEAALRVAKKHIRLTEPVSVNQKMVEAAQGVIDRWNSPSWKDLPATAEYIHKLRDSLASMPEAKVWPSMSLEQLEVIAKASYDDKGQMRDAVKAVLDAAGVKYE